MARRMIIYVHTGTLSYILCKPMLLHRVIGSSLTSIDHVGRANNANKIDPRDRSVRNWCYISQCRLVGIIGIHITSHITSEVSDLKAIAVLDWRVTKDYVKETFRHGPRTSTCYRRIILVCASFYMMARSIPTYESHIGPKYHFYWMFIGLLLPGYS